MVILSATSLLLLTLQLTIVTSWKSCSFKTNHRQSRLPIAVQDDITKTQKSLIKFSDKLTLGWKDALLGNTSSLENMLSDSTIWDNPFVSSTSELKEGFKKFSIFFEDIKFIVLNTTESSSEEVVIDYQLSFNYPAPWRPRVIIPGKACVITKDFETIESLREKWSVSVMDIFFKQVRPRWWDIWHVFCSPCPENPPPKTLGKVGAVSFVELPTTVAIEVSWAGAAKFPGPPLLVLPAFSLFGGLKTSRPNRDTFYTVLPVEVQSSRWLISGQEYKRSSWIIPVPSYLQDQVLSQAQRSEYQPVPKNPDEIGEELEDDFVEEVDYQIGLENLDVMKSVTAGALRGDVTLNKALMQEFADSERKEYRYTILPSRTIAQVDIFGEAKPEAIEAAIRSIQTAVSSSNGDLICKQPMKIKPLSTLDSEHSNRNDEVSVPGCNQLGLQLCYVKACFNPRAEPAMAIYEMQYSSRLTRVFLELEKS